MGNRRRWLRWIKASTKIEYFGSLVQPNQILDSFEQAQSTGNKEEHRRLMTFAIVGGGATEIKLSATLAEMRKFVLSQNYPGLNINEKRIILLDGSSRLLSAFSEKSSKEVTDYLKKHDVEIKLNQRVMGYENYQLYNPQNEMFRLLGTKRSFSQNETFFFSHPYPLYPALFRLISHF